ncbi:MAG TPA: PP2C family protein-serine/threonine phosphatase [Terracidiphilus sp.]|jgi:sigma-B regulation protein RsbU (phosphoserine phosphatase)|nr:PP2C family protein-serine/threonine phosphatase [Terracidiphilus sp.]
MFLDQAPITAQEVLRVFHRDEPALFLGAAFNTIALICFGFCLVRRRFNALLVWLALFASLYGTRLWLQTDIVSLTLAQREIFHRIREAINYLVPIPAFFFFQAVGLLPRRGKLITGILALVFSSLAALSVFEGSIPLVHKVNNVIVILALFWVLFQAYFQGSRDRDFVVLRSGLLCFAVVAFWDNLGGARLLRADLEPYGFALLLASLGYVAARRTLQREEQLNEIQKELSLARSIQLSLLPGDFPGSSSFRVAALYVPMTSVAGDFYDFVVAGEASAGLLIADVSGHGVPAALIASMVKMAAISQREQAAHPGLVLTGMNRALFGNTQGQYVTAAYASLDAERGELRYAAAGHPAMLLLRQGEVREVVENGLLLAAVDGIEYSERALALAPGDRIVLYTDGIVEARNAAGHIFGEDALTSAIRMSASMAPREAALEVVRSVQAWSPNQDDDLTILVCDYAGG